MTYIIIGIVLLVVIIVSSQAKEQDNTYKAEFVSPTSVMSSFNYGFSLAGGLRATSRDVAYKNCLVVGGSGSGKSSVVLLASIFTLARGGSSLCVMDPAGMINKLTSGWLKKKGYTIYCIDFGPTADSFNCIGNIKSVSEAQQIAYILIKNSGIESKSDPYWSASAEMMCSIFIEYLAFHTPKENCTMASLVKLTDVFAGDPSRIDKLFAKVRDPELITKYKAMIAVSEKTMQSSLSCVRTALKIFGTPALRHCTATNTIDFSTFRKTKSILYICTPINDVNFYAPLSALLFEALFKEIMSRIPSKDERAIFCLIDEMVTMRFQNLGLVYSNCRKFKAGCMGLIQDERMLEMNFSVAEAHAIKSNSFSKVYLPGQPLKTCQDLEAILGKTTIINEETKVEKVQPLAPASTIRMLKEAIILVGNEPPIKAKPISFYNHWLLRYRTAIPPYVPETKPTTTEPPLISL